MVRALEQSVATLLEVEGDDRRRYVDLAVSLRLCDVVRDDHGRARWITDTDEELIGGANRASTVGAVSPRVVAALARRAPRRQVPPGVRRARHVRGAHAARGSGRSSNPGGDRRVRAGDPRAHAAALITDCAAALAVYYLRESKQALTENETKAHEARLQWLDHVRTGRIRIDEPSPRRSTAVRSAIIPLGASVTRELRRMKRALKKLRLTPDTIRTLSPRSLAAAAGPGGGYETNKAECPTVVAAAAAVPTNACVPS